MFSAGLTAEVRSLLAAGLSPEVHAMKAIGYRQCCRVVFGAWTEDEARQATLVATRQLAKRQLTWLRGEPELIWLARAGEEALEEAESHVEASGGPGTGAFEGWR